MARELHDPFPGTEAENYQRALEVGMEEESKPAPIPMRLVCEGCGKLHIDEGEFATKPHHTHSCQFCGLTWRPAVVPTVGVQFLPGFKNSWSPEHPFGPNHTMPTTRQEAFEREQAEQAEARRKPPSVAALSRRITDLETASTVDDGVAIRCVFCGAVAASDDPHATIEHDRECVMEGRS